MCIAAPPPEAIEKIAQTLLTTSDVTTCLSTINTLKVANGLALADIITALSELLVNMEVKPEAMIRWLDGLAEIEYRVSGGGSEVIQTGAVVGVIRVGCELAGATK
jgi:replication factor C subunit 3/5